MLLQRSQLLLLATMFFACSGGNFKGGSNNGSAPGGAISGDENAINFPNSGNGNSVTTPGALPTADQVTALKEKCAKAAEASFKTTEQTITYPERKVCTFGVAPNLGKKDAFIQASETSPATLTLPAGEICAINIDSPTENAQLHYDDFLILTIDSRIVFMSNKDIVNYLDPAQQGIVTWDFGKVVGQKIVNFDSAPYCLATGANCLLPKTDKDGPVALHFTANDIAPIAASISGKPSAAMNLTATGDNDDRDCYHTALSVKVKIKYLP